MNDDFRRTEDTEYFIFYHDRDKLNKVFYSGADARFRPVDLNELDLPRDFVVPNLDERLNRALFSEYLGILSVRPEPNTRWVGCFTYSVPVKFSYTWANESGVENFLPPIRFESLSHLEPEPGKLYYVEKKSPRQGATAEIQDIHEKFPAGSEIRPGPYKGSFIVERETFDALQEWLWRVIHYLLQKYELDKIPERENVFDTSVTAKRSPEQQKVDKLRHKLGDIFERAVAYFLGAQFENDRKVRIGQALKEMHAQSDLIQSVERLARNDSIILAFGNIKYGQVIQEWIKRLESLGISNYLVVSQDHELAESLDQSGKNVTTLPFSGTLGEFWVHRMVVMQRVLEAGYNVLHSDADAFWIRDIRDSLDAEKADIVASQGTIQPPDVVKEWGFVICAGLILFRSNRRTLEYVEKATSRSRELNSDQIALNRTLLQERVRWDTLVRKRVRSFKDQKFYTSSGFVRGRANNNLTVSLIPHEIVQRLPGKYTSKLSVLHALSGKNQAAKFEVLESCERDLENIKQNKKNVVWLSSYPRSGNTMMRAIFKHNFGLDTYSLYNDQADIGKDPAMREFVGHRDGDWGVARDGKVRQFPDHPEKLYATADQHPTIVKTHSQFCDFYEGHRTILVVRDPRAAINSAAHYISDFAEPDRDLRDILSEQVVAGDPNSGHWSDHLESWIKGCDDLLILKFEDIVDDFDGTLDRVADFIDRAPVSKKRKSFSEFQKVNQKFFRSGKKSAWRDNLTAYDQYLIRVGQGKTAARFGYDLQENENVERPSGAHLQYMSKAATLTKPWVFVVTPTFNAADTIDTTILSVVSQAGDFFLRYHVQDGGSTDGTIEKLEAWEEKLRQNQENVFRSNIEFSFSSSSDEGMYDAVNKGFEQICAPEHAVCTYLNADDVLIQGALATAGHLMSKQPDIEWLVPSKYTMGQEFNHRGQGQFTPAQSYIHAGLCDGRFRPVLQQEGIFWRYGLWEKVGGFRTDLKFAGDWDLWRRFSSFAAPFYTSYVFGVFRRRAGQASENWIAYQEEIDSVVSYEKREKALAAIANDADDESVLRVQSIRFSRQNGYETVFSQDSFPKSGVRSSGASSTRAANKSARGEGGQVSSQVKGQSGPDSGGFAKENSESDTSEELARTQRELESVRKKLQLAEVDRDSVLAKKDTYKSVAGGIIEELRHTDSELLGVYEEFKDNFYHEQLGNEDAATQHFLEVLRRKKDEILGATGGAYSKAAEGARTGSAETDPAGDPGGDPAGDPAEDRGKQGKASDENARPTTDDAAASRGVEADNGRTPGRTRFRERWRRIGRG